MNILSRSERTTIAADRYFVHGADGIGALGAGGFETGEIVPTEEALPCLMHRGCIERLGKMPGKMPIENRGRAAVVDLIAIAFADGIVRGGEIFRGVVERADCDVVRQQRVETAQQVVVG